MIEHPSSSPSPSSVSTHSSTHDSSCTDDQKSTVANPSGSLDDTLHPDAGPATPSTPTAPSKLRPARKAPPPPLKIENSTHESKLPTLVGSKTPKQGRPKVAPPEPPVRDRSKLENLSDKNCDDSGPLYEAIKSDIKSNTGDVSGGLYSSQSSNDSKTASSAKSDKTKPPVPKRNMKPKLVTVPRSEIKLPDLRKTFGDGELMKLRSPPPPKPVAPKLGPIRAKLTAPKPLEDESALEEENLMFQVNSQRKFDDIVRQDSEDRDSVPSESPPYRSLSSFGSTFGKMQTTPTTSAQKSNSFGKKLEPLTEPSEKVTNENVQKIDGIDKNKEIGMNSVETQNLDNANNDKTFMEVNDIEVAPEEVTCPSNEKHLDSENAKSSKSSIPVTPSKKGSKLPPPKHGLANLKTESPKPEDKTVGEPQKASTPEKLSKIPKSKIEPSSKMPAVASNQPKTGSDKNIFQYPEVGEVKEITDQKMEKSDNKTVNDNGDIVTDLNDQELRPRTESLGKPPVAPKPKSNLPKVLPKPKPVAKGSDNEIKEDVKTAKSDISTNDVNDSVALPDTVTSTVTKERNRSDSEGDAKASSKIPLTSAVVQKSPQGKGKKSGIPSPSVRKPSIERAKEHDTEIDTAPGGAAKGKMESPQLPRKDTNKTPNAAEHKSLRNRSNSPASRTGIPKSVRNRSNSPAAKSSGIPTPGGGSNKSASKQKRSGLVPPKKIVNGQGKQVGVDSDQPDDIETGSEKDDSFEQPSPTVEHQSRLPMVHKQPSQDTKPPKSGKSLLPVIHKSLETGVGSPNGVSQGSPGNKQKRGIPVAKPARPPPPKSPSADQNHRLVVWYISRTIFL